MKNAYVLLIGLLVILLLSAGIFVFKKNNISNTKTQTMETALKPTEDARMVGKSIYGEFSKSEYDSALASGKIIVLDFYANWCPICRGEAPEIQAGFDSLANDGVVGFRVNFKDTETDKDEEQLAKEFNIPIQHTKIILQNGKEVTRSSDPWDRQTLIENVTNVINK